MYMKNKMNGTTSYKIVITPNFITIKVISKQLFSGTDFKLRKKRRKIILHCFCSFRSSSPKFTYANCQDNVPNININKLADHEGIFDKFY